MRFLITQITADEKVINNCRKITLHVEYLARADLVFKVLTRTKVNSCISRVHYANWDVS